MYYNFPPQNLLAGCVKWPLVGCAQPENKVRWEQAVSNIEGVTLDLTPPFTLSGAPTGHPVLAEQVSPVAQGNLVTAAILLLVAKESPLFPSALTESQQLNTFCLRGEFI